jgi:hypothetical protein
MRGGTTTAMDRRGTGLQRALALCAGLAACAPGETTRGTTPLSCRSETVGVAEPTRFGYTPLGAVSALAGGRQRFELREDAGFFAAAGLGEAPRGRGRAREQAAFLFVPSGAIAYVTGDCGETDGLRGRVSVPGVATAQLSRGIRFEASGSLEMRLAGRRPWVGSFNGWSDGPPRVQLVWELGGHSPTAILFSEGRSSFWRPLFEP